jgi:SAM-dependent methyltransferase
MIQSKEKLQINKFNKEYFKYLIPQRTRLTTEYALTKDSSDEQINNALTTMMIKDYDMIKDILPTQVENILDIGCGLGLIDLALYNHYNGNISINLLDKTNTISEDTSVRGFNKEYVFYNSMDATTETLTSNGVTETALHAYEVNDESLKIIEGKQFDLILSFLSCGWHYSIETYVELIKKTLKSDGVLILDIRHNTGQLEYAMEHFNLVDTIINTAESKHTGGTIGDRYVFKQK